jgi:hypothetical protein
MSCTINLLAGYNVSLDLEQDEVGGDTSAGRIRPAPPRCSTTSVPKSNAVTAPAVAPQRRCDGATVTPQRRCDGATVTPQRRCNGATEQA